MPAGPTVRGMSTEDVTFETVDGVTLRGVLYLPDRAAGADETIGSPGVVMAHGFSATKEMGLPPFAEEFCRAGLAVLLYDHRNLGASDGTPRQEINPWAQARDYRAALSFLAARTKVDADRLAVWGSSFSGGEVLLVGACDDRVRAVVANVPFAGLPGTEYGADTDERFEAMRASFLDETGGGLADRPGDPLGPMPVVNEPGTEGGFLGQPESSDWFLDVGRRPGSTWRNEVTVRNAFGTDPAFDPGVCVAHIAPTPLLMVVASDDRVAEAEVALAAYERADEPKRLEVIGGDHFSAYSGDGFDRASTAAREFLVDALAAPAPMGEGSVPESEQGGDPACWADQFPDH